MMLILTSCRENGNQKISVEEINLKNLMQEDGSYSFMGVPFGSSMKEVEDIMNYEFPYIPYSCTEWDDGTLPEHPEDVMDYKNSTDYESVSMTAYRNEHPIQYKYEDYTAHVVFEFSHDELFQVIIMFGQTESIWDSKMNYGGNQQDVHSAFDELKDGLNKSIGEYDRVVDNEYTTNEPSYFWESDTDIGDGYISKIGLHKNIVEGRPEYDVTLLLLTRMKEVNGNWVQND